MLPPLAVAAAPPFTEGSEADDGTGSASDRSIRRVTRQSFEGAK
jgi:hypothetical protein